MQEKQFKIVGAMLFLPLALWACGAGGTDAEPTAPDTPTIATPRVIEPARSNIATPETTASPATTLPGGTATTLREFQSYEVQIGDSISAIAEKFPGVSVDDILAANNLADRNRIFPGQELLIPLVP